MISSACFSTLIPTAPCLTFRLTRRTAPGPASNISMRWGIGRSPCWRGRTAQSRAKLRLKSWLETLDGYGLKPVTVLHGNWDAQSGYAGALQMLRETPNFSAVLVGNDQMALGVLSAFHQHQVAVPGEKSVIGYDDTYESLLLPHPALSTVSLDLDLQGKAGGAADPRQHQRGASCLIHSAGAPGDTPFQRAPELSREKICRPLRNSSAPSPTVWHPDAKGGETRLITLPLN